MVTTTPDPPAAADVAEGPSVLAVLVVRNGATWLRDCLQSLAAQRYPRLGVVAVDGASTDGSPEILAHALGEGRVLRLPEDLGIAGALHAATALPAFQAADYLLIVHDDAALAPDAVVRMVEAAEGIHGVERVGVVGPKVVDWDDPRVLREIGRSTDSFGHPFNPLQEGERDQGQHDRVLEVLYVSSCAMLIDREAWQRTGQFDERYGGHHDDLDFCWRARLAGYRVLMTPLAGARHREAGPRGERGDQHRPRSSRYYAERSGLASMLKDYAIVTLLWTLPIYAVASLVRLVFLLLGRRFEDAYDLGAAWGWNLVHLFGTIRRRVRAQSVRRVRDRHVRRFMASPFRLPRWFERAEEILEEQREGEEEERPRLRQRAASLAAAHPVLVGSFLAVGLGALAVRHFLGSEVLTGGALASFPAHSRGFFDELVSATRGTVLGGVQPASPALAGLGGLSWLTFGGTALAQKVFLAALPPVAAVVLYRALSRQTAQSAAAVVGSAAYVLSALMLWGFSEGRSSFLVAMAALPAVWDRLDAAFAGGGRERSGRAIVSVGVALAVSFAFLPGSVLAVGLLLVVMLVAGRRRGRGLLLAVSGAVAAAVLVFPSLLDAARAPSAALSSSIGTDDVWTLLRLAPGGGPGTWILAAFLPVSAALCFAVVGKELRGRAWRSAILAIAGVGLAWASSARYLPEPLANAPVYLTAAALGMASLVAYGLAALGSRMGREEFGFRQIAAALLAIVISVGLGAQAMQVALAEWAVRPNGLPPAWPIVAASPPGEFRILWLGRVSGEPFPAPGGDPSGIVEAGDASVRFGLTDRDGLTALDTGRGEHGAGYDELRTVLQELLSGSTSHAGQLLGPLGIRFLIADEGDLPPAASERLGAQLDLDVVPAGGLVIYRNARVMPVASVVHSARFARAADGDDLPPIASLPDVRTTSLERAGRGWEGSTQEDGYAYVATQYASGWRAENDGLRVEVQDAFGWAVGAAVRAGEVSFTYGRQWIRTLEMLVLAVLWIAALWITRKPVSA